MALGNSNENAVFVKLHERVINNAKKLVFSRREKVEGTDEYKDGEHYTAIDGTLKGVSISQYEFESQLIDKMTLRIEDETDNTLYLVSGNFNFATRALMNKLMLAASESEINGAKVDINTKTDAEGFHSIFLKVNGTNCKQMFPNDKQPKRREFEGKGGKKEYDDKPLNDFFKNAMELYVLPQFETIESSKESEV